MKAKLAPLTAVSVALLLFLQAEVQAQGTKKSLTLRQALSQGRSRVNWFTTPLRPFWAPDGVHYAVRIEGKEVWVHPETGAERAPDPKTKPSPPVAPGGRPPGGQTSPLRQIRTDLFLGPPGERDRKKLKRLTKDAERKQVPMLSPDRAWASFARDSGFSIVDTKTTAEWKVTTDGSADMLYGVLDWVYQEELYGRGDFQGHWWSSNSQAVAFLALDESKVKTFTLIDHVPVPSLDDERAVAPEITRYPKAGDPNPTAELKVAWPKTKKVVDVDLSGYDKDILIVRVGWVPDGSKMLVAITDRIQTWMDLNTVDPATGTVQRILRETSDAWVNRLPFPRYLADGSFLWFSERTGYKHIYHYEADGKLRRAVTTGEWQVRRIVRMGEVDGVACLWFTGTKDGAINDNLYRIQLDGEKLTRLTQGDGYHITTLNKAGSWFLDRVSTVDQPTEVRLCKGDGSSHKVLGRSTPLDVKSHVYRPRKYLSVTARDGYELDCTLIKPPAFDSGSKYPVYLRTYSGPDHPTVRNSFVIRPWEQYLAQQGVLILQCNVRSASGRGQKHTAMAYRRLGVTELRDLEDAVEHVCAEHGGDRTRVCIDGWSYGGFMAAYALTHSKKFSLGIAGAGVHDWRLYDTIYTERYMSTPQLNPKGYKETSVTEAAKNLHGHLVILHGGRDDNVHLQNSMRLVFNLQKAGKDNFELMIYPRSRHGVRSTHKNRMIWRAIRDSFGLQDAGAR